MKNCEYCGWLNCSGWPTKRFCNKWCRNKTNGIIRIITPERISDLIKEYPERDVSVLVAGFCEQRMRDIKITYKLL